MDEPFQSRIAKLRNAVRDRFASDLSQNEVVLSEPALEDPELPSCAGADTPQGRPKALGTSEEIPPRAETKAATKSMKSLLLARAKIAKSSSHKVQGSSRELPPIEALQPKSEEDAIRLAIEKMSGRDRLGLAGEHIALAGGSLAGVSAAGTVATVAGASTLFGSTTLAGVFGGLFVTTTPIGWVVGSAVAMGAAGYGIARMIRSGSEQDRARKDFVERQTKRLMSLEMETITVDGRVELSQLVALTVAGGVIDQVSASRMVDLVDSGSLSPELALERIRSLALAKGLIELKS